MIWFKEPTLEELNERSRDSLAGHLGIVFDEVGRSSLSASMPVDGRTKQPWGVLHGGASCALAETVGSVAANYCVDPDQFLCVGLDLNINHLRSVPEGNLVTAVATACHIGRSTQVWEIRLYYTDRDSKAGFGGGPQPAFESRDRDRHPEKRLSAISRLTIAVLSRRR
jgi:1,4-dihydroxy-2-naphthoyl-CoA hydrolase